uniref:RPA_interact_C domain-containing protein n=1 Tax=Strongyloides venezuelensis TaxID=75913 RepID=A0A0K0FIT2_STRVS
MISSENEIFFQNNDVKNQDEDENDAMLKRRCMILYCEKCKKLVNSVVTWQSNDVKDENFNVNKNFPYIYQAIPCIYYLQLRRANEFASAIHRCPQCDNVLESFLNMNK